MRYLLDRNYPPAPDRCEEEIPTHHTSDRTFWQQVVKDPHCQEHVQGPSEQSPWVQVQRFRPPESSIQGEVDDTEEGTSAVQPDDDWVSDIWRHRTINAVSVHIEGKSACIVAVPVAAHQLAECMDGATPDTDWTRYELTWLSRLVTRLTSSQLKSGGAWERLGRVWQGELKDADVLHKNDPGEVGDELVYVRACRSVRLAYSTLVQSATSEQEIGSTSMIPVV